MKNKGHIRQSYHDLLQLYARSPHYFFLAKYQKVDFLVSQIPDC